MATNPKKGVISSTTAYLRKQFIKNPIGVVGAAKGYQLVSQKDEEGNVIPEKWELDESKFKFQENDRKESASDTWSVGWNNAASVTTGTLGILALTLKEVQFITLAQYSVPILLTQALLRVMFNWREYSGAQNKNANKLVKASINTAIFLAYIAATVITFAYSALLTTVLPFIGLSVSTVRMFQGFGYSYANYRLEKKLLKHQKQGKNYDPLQLERVRIQKQKRLLQGVGSGLVVIAAALVCVGGYSVALPAIATFSLIAASINVTAMVYMTAREFPAGQKFLRARWLFAPELNPDPKNEKENGPSLHQNHLRDENWQDKEKRLTNDSHSAEGVHLFQGDILQEIAGIYNTHIKDFADSEGTEISPNEAKREMCKKYMLRLIEQKIVVLEKQKNEGANEHWAQKRYRQFQERLGFIATKEQLNEKIAFAECLKRLVLINNDSNSEEYALDANNPFHQIKDYDGLEQHLRDDPSLMNRVFGGFYSKFSDMEVLYRVLCPAPATETYANRGYFSFLSDNPVKPAVSLGQQPVEQKLDNPPVQLAVTSDDLSLGQAPSLSDNKRNHSESFGDTTTDQSFSSDGSNLNILNISMHSDDGIRKSGEKYSPKGVDEIGEPGSRRNSRSNSSCSQLFKSAAANQETLVSESANQEDLEQDDLENGKASHLL